LNGYLEVPGCSIGMTFEGEYQTGDEEEYIVEDDEADNYSAKLVRAMRSQSPDEQENGGLCKRNGPKV
jgi:hypothetical protein